KGCHSEHVLIVTDIAEPPSVQEDGGLIGIARDVHALFDLYDSPPVPTLACVEPCITIIFPASSSTTPGLAGNWIVGMSSNSSQRSGRTKPGSNLVHEVRNIANTRYAATRLNLTVVSISISRVTGAFTTRNFSTKIAHQMFSYLHQRGGDLA